MEQSQEIINGRERYIVMHDNKRKGGGPGLCVVAHSHSYIEILYCLSGTHEALTFIFYLPFITCENTI